jgi:ankyrin repeat protein
VRRRRALPTASAALAILLTVGLVGPAAADGADLRLLEAVRTRDRASVDALLKQRVDVNEPQPDGATALHWAVHWEDLALADLLIRAGANVNAANDLGVTPLLMACGSGNSAIAERLLAAGADARAALESGETALMLASRTGALGAVKALVAGGADVNARERTRGQTALMWAVANRHPEIARVLLERGADIRARSGVRRRVYIMGGNRSAGSASRDTPIAEIDEGGSTPLLFAARSGDLESARMLIAAGADVNDTAADGNTALVIAAHSGNGTLAALLLDKGADPNAAPLGYTALHAAVLRGTLSDRGVKNPDQGAGVALVKVLLDKGANPNARVLKGTRVRRWSQDFAFLDRWVGATPFWLAAKFLEVEMMRVLTDAGADPLLVSRDRTTALMVAAGNGYSRGTGTEAFIKDRRDFSSYNSEPLEIATRIPADEERLALQAATLAVELGVDVNAANDAGDTALHAAAALGMDSVIQFLAGKGANLEAKNKAGRTPLASARREDGVGASVVREKTAALLRQLGAKQ